MRTPRRPIRKAILAVLGLALFSIAGSAIAQSQDDPPNRVARLSFLRGDVSFQPSGDDDWVQANLNRPLGTGDRLYTDHDSRVEMEVGAATLRLDAQSSFNILNLNDTAAQTELTQGVMNLHVRRVFEGQSYEVDTPTLAFVITQPGNYRVDIAPDGSSTMVTVFSGTGDVYGENNASYSVRQGESVRFHDAALQDYEVLDIPRGDDFDSWVDSRNNRYEHATSRQYVSEDVIGYADLDDYGGWNDTPEYGHVWYPSQVDAGWAPYRSGHWAWVDPWGWTWVDNAAWGFAPFHYGRWVYASDRWGWCPGPVNVRPIYAPALVAFVGGAGWGVGISTGPVGWFPLGPRDVYVPWYHSSHDYFTNVNVRNTTVINNTNITNIYNNYSAGRPINNANYAYRQNVAAVTAVPRDAFVGARPVNAARVQVSANQLRNANVVSRVGITPQRASFTGAAGQTRVQPASAVQNRNVIARTQPPPRAASVDTRIAAIQHNDSQPLPQSQMRRIAPAAAAGAAAVGAAAVAGNRSQPQHVQVVGHNASKPQPLPARPPGAGATAGNAQQRVQPATRGPATPSTTANPNTRVPPQTREANTPARTQTPDRTAPQTQSGNANGLPSSRFAPHTGQAPRTNGETPQRTTTPSSNATRNSTTTGEHKAPAGTSSRTPPTTHTPAERTQTPASSTERRTTTTPSTRTAPTTTTRTPPTETQHRTTTAPQERTTSPSSSQQRTSPPTTTQREYAPRTAPQQHTAPPPAQTQTRTPPQTQQRTPPPQQQHAPPAERKAPPPKDTKKDKDEEDGGHR